MSKGDIMYSGILKKTGGKLVFRNPADEKTYKMFVDSMEEGSVIHVFFDANKDDGTLAQIAKVKVCIRKIALETGDSFEKTQFQIKLDSGLCFRMIKDGILHTDCKSFGDCSKEELSLAIETIIQVGDFLGIDFR